MEMRAYKSPVVWLDLDDTLIDFTTNAEAALEAMYASEWVLRGRFESANAWIETYERHNQELWTQYARSEITREYLRMERFRRPLVEGGMSDREARAVSERYDTLYLDLLAEGRVLMPGALELLGELRSRGVTVGILSNGFREVQYRKIHNCGLEPYIDIVVLSDDIGVNKPDPRIYAYAAERVGIAEPKNHIMVGDNPETDIRGAIGAGWRAVWYLPERAERLYTREQCATGAMIADSLSDVAELLSLK